MKNRNVYEGKVVSVYEQIKLILALSIVEIRLLTLEIGQQLILYTEILISF